MFLTEYLISVDIDLIVQELHQYLKNNIPVCQIFSFTGKCNTAAFRWVVLRGI